MIFAIVGFGKMGHFYDALVNARYLVERTPVANRICFPNVEEFIAYRQPVDLVIVATPTDDHYPTTKKLLNAYYNVLVEKPLCLSSHQAEELEALALQKKVILYQSTLERYNPLVKFLKKNIAPQDIVKIESFRFGKRPPRSYVEDPKFDLGVHDVDLWFHLFHREVPWEVNIGFGEPRREIIVTRHTGGPISFDLLHKVITINGNTLDFSKASNNNPILEMLYDLIYKGFSMNERWSREIRILEQANGSPIILS